MLHIIARELQHLNNYAAPGRVELYTLALAQAERRCPEGLRARANLVDPTGEDERKLPQRAGDRLSVLLDRCLANQSAAGRYGVGSVIFSGHGGERH